MKLYVWCSPDSVLMDYSNGMIVALAADLEQALAAIKHECDYARGFEPIPTQTIDLPGCKKVPAKAWLVWGGG